MFAKARKVLGWSIGIVALIYLAFILAKDWNLLIAQHLSPRYEILIFAFLLLCFYIPLLGVVWGLIVRALGTPIKLADASRVRTIGDMARYMPGKIWLFVGRMGLAKKEGIPHSIGFLSLVIEIVANLIAGFILFLIGLPFLKKLPLPGWMNLSFFLVPLGLISLHPKIFGAMINLGLKMLKKGSMELNLKYKNILLFVFFYGLFWIFQGFCFFLIAKSIYPLTWDFLMPMVAISTISWIGGFLSFITPSGIGIREGIFTALLSMYLPLPVAIIISLATRIAITAAEVLTALLLFKKKYFFSA